MQVPELPGLTIRQVAWRMVVLGLGVLVITAVTLFGSDRTWPFAPMGQYAFSVPDNGEIHSPGIEGQTMSGEIVRLPLSTGGVGIRRAEIEGQIPLLIEQPYRLQAIAVQIKARHPQWPAYQQIRLVDDVTYLRNGTLDRTEHKILATWQVDNPMNPKPVTKQVP